jgi:hypothetical protein
MTGILLAPMVVGMDATFSTNIYEPLFWMTIALALIELARLAGRGIRGGLVVGGARRDGGTRS